MARCSLLNIAGWLLVLSMLAAFASGDFLVAGVLLLAAGAIVEWGIA
jgi:hypothetical protein